MPGKFVKRFKARPNTRKSGPKRFDSRKFDRREDDSSEDVRPQADQESSSGARLPQVEKTFQKLWESLFSSPVHLDSALSKLPPRLKSILAQLVPQVLMRPASLAEKMGIGIPLGEPWALSKKELTQWRPAQILIKYSYMQMSSGKLDSEAIEEDFPPWMMNEWKDSWGRSVAEELVAALTREPPLSLRVSTREDRQKILQELTSTKKLPVKTIPSPFSPLGIRLAHYAQVMQTEAFQRGGFEIQDEGSQILSIFALWPELFKNLLQNKPGRVKGQFELAALPSVKEFSSKTIVDACAGAGGKSLAIADILKGKGRVFSYDISQSKLQALKRRATRGNLNNIKAVLLKEGEESLALQSFKQKADIVLVDAPCSGWGVLRRNPDIKWRQDTETVRRMPQIQKRLLEVYSDLVAPGGTLVYGLCTFRRDETLGVVSDFSSAHSEFKPWVGGFLGPDPCDGFYMHAWKKV